MSEHEKAALDALLFGNGFVQYDPDGNVKHVPISEVIIMKPSLLARLEKATGPDRQLDLAIHIAIFGRPSVDNLGELLASKAYTGSIDAAMTLVPQDAANPGKSMLWSISFDEDGVAGPRSYLAELGYGYHNPKFIYGHHASSAALALCIAAMKARAK